MGGNRGVVTYRLLWEVIDESISMTVMMQMWSKLLGYRHYLVQGVRLPQAARTNKRKINFHWDGVEALMISECG